MKRTAANGLLCATLLLTSCGPPPIKNLEGKLLPPVGKEVQVVEKTGWLAKDLVSLAELMEVPKINLLAMSPAESQERIDEELRKNAQKLVREGRLLQVTPGTKARVLGYYAGGHRAIRPLGPGERTASWVQLSILEGEAKQQTGFTTSDGIQ